MLVLEFKARTNCQKASAIDEAIRTTQFIRNKSLRSWMDVRGTSKYDLQKYCKILARDSLKETRTVNAQGGQGPMKEVGKAAASSGTGIDNLQNSIIER